MLKQRVLTALLLLCGVLAAIWLLPTAWLYILFSAFSLLAASEWTHLMGWARWTRSRKYYLLFSAALLAGLWPIRLVAWKWLAGLAIAWWFFAIWLIQGYPERIRRRPGVISLALLGQLLWSPTVLCLAQIHDQSEGQWKLIYVLTLVWVADTGAFFAGRAFGRRKLAPNLSPGKTLEGAAAGIVLSMIWAFSVGGFIFGFQGSKLGWLIGVGFMGAVASIVGDLTMSLFKRMADLKDFGTILPGHGGVLDRVDGLLAAIPVITVMLRVGGMIQ